MNHLSKQIFYINSEKRITGNPSEFNILLDGINANHNYNRICVLQANIPKSFYLIQEGHNTFQLSETINDVEIVVTCTIPPGNYTKSSWLSILSQVLQNNSPNTIYYACTFDMITGKIIIDTPTDTTTLKRIIVSLDMYEQLGFDKYSINSFTVPPLISKNIIKLSNKDTIYIQSNSIDESTPILQEIFCNTSDYSSISFINPNIEFNSKQYIRNNNNSLNIVITDEDNIKLDLNGLNIVLSIVLYEINDSLEIMKKDIIINNLDKIPINK